MERVAKQIFEFEEIKTELLVSYSYFILKRCKKYFKEPFDSVDSRIMFDRFMIDSIKKLNMRYHQFAYEFLSKLQK
jgi:hypothetical protein